MWLADSQEGNTRTHTLTQRRHVVLDSSRGLGRKSHRKKKSNDASQGVEAELTHGKRPRKENWVLRTGPKQFNTWTKKMRREREQNEKKRIESDKNVEQSFTEGVTYCLSRTSSVLSGMRQNITKQKKKTETSSVMGKKGKGMTTRIA